jgi:hypothetical protein
VWSETSGFAQHKPLFGHFQCDHNFFMPVPAGESILKAVDPLILEALHESTLGHKIVLARGMVKFATSDKTTHQLPS